jgi:hypothetical protein
MRGAKYSFVSQDATKSLKFLQRIWSYPGKWHSKDSR